jgi:hypothetical protein
MAAPTRALALSGEESPDELESFAAPTTTTAVITTYSVMARHVDGRGSVAVEGVPDDTEEGTLRELVREAYRAK